MNQYLTFFIHDEEYAVEILRVKVHSPRFPIDKIVQCDYIDTVCAVNIAALQIGIAEANDNLGHTFAGIK